MAEENQNQQSSAEESQRQASEQEPQQPQTTTVTDSAGNDFEVEVGADGESPVSPNNPPEKAVLAQSDAEVDNSPNEPNQPVQGHSEESTASSASAEGEASQEVQPPSRSASKAEWKAYVVEHQGYSEQEADEATRDELAEEFGR